MKIDVTISSKNHINVGDFSSIEPSVQLTVKDVDVTKYDEVYSHLKTIVETSSALQGLSDFEEIVNMVSAKEDVKEYFRQIFKQKENIESARMESIQHLEKIKNEI